MIDYLEGFDDPDDYNDFPMPLERLYEEANKDANFFRAKISEGEERLIIGSTFEGTTYFAVEKFVAQVIATKNIPFSFADASGKCEVQHYLLANHLLSFDTYLEEYSEKFVYSPHVELFFSTVNDLGMLNGMPGMNPRIFWPKVDSVQAENFNLLVKKIRDKAKAREFTRKSSDRNRDCRRNFESARNYVNYLFDNVRSRILVLRLDLGFRVRSEVGVDDAVSFFKRFLNNRRSNSVFNDVIGYVWKLEMGESKGYHFHLFFFLDGSQTQKDAHRTQKIGEYWEALTGGLGCFHNVNLEKKRYQTLGIGIGMINHFDLEMRGYLMRTLKYFFKKEQILRVKLKKRMRTFGHGEIPSITSSAGRPRKKSVQIS